MDTMNPSVAEDIISVGLDFGVVDISNLVLLHSCLDLTLFLPCVVAKWRGVFGSWE